MENREQNKGARDEENRRIRTFRVLADLTFQRLHLEPMTLEEARREVGGLRQAAERFFPGKASVFDLVVAPRLERVIAERFGGVSPRSH